MASTLQYHSQLPILTRQDVRDPSKRRHCRRVLASVRSRRARGSKSKQLRREKTHCKTQEISFWTYRIVSSIVLCCCAHIPKDPLYTNTQTRIWLQTHRHQAQTTNSRSKKKNPAGSVRQERTIKPATYTI